MKFLQELDEVVAVDLEKDEERWPLTFIPTG